ncbi:MAG TPA: outer membrane lipoprotein-sorting protein [Rectinemataceae bacterium]|nr:outer membrane lipoprotein-sorting protein [Rectinemataceae bacterium]
MKRLLFIATLAGLVCLSGAAQAAPMTDPNAILARVDANMSFGDIRYSGRMEITIGGETRYKTMTAVAEGSDKAFAEFTNPEDRGTRYLKLDKNLWIYFPKEQDTVKISGHLLKEGMMGSDVSYEDALESRDFHLKYRASLKGQEAVGDRQCYVVQLDATVASAAYDRRVMWIDTERFVVLKEEMYAKSGKLLKTSATLEVQRVGDRWYPTRTEFVSKLRNNTRTVFAMSAVEFNVTLDPRQFTMAALTK